MNLELGRDIRSVFASYLKAMAKGDAGTEIVQGRDNNVRNAERISQKYERRK
jgi:hypothetical protein